MLILILDDIDIIKDLIIKQADHCRKRDHQLMKQLLTLNGSNTRLCATLQQMDKKLNTVMAADCRMRSFAVPIPTIPSPFLKLLPVKNEEELTIVENLINTIESDDAVKNIKDLVSIFEF